MLYPIAISPGDEQHAWGVEVPDIPGCFSAGDDLDDAMAMAREAIEGHLEILAEDNAKIPVASKVNARVANPEYQGCITLCQPKLHARPSKLLMPEIQNGFFLPGDALRTRQYGSAGSQAGLCSVSQPFPETW